MRKWISIFFLIVFGITNTGFSIDIHFCDDEITDIAFFDDASCVCDKTEEIKSEHCCAVEEKISPQKCHTSHTKFSEHKNCCKNQKLVFKKFDYQTTVAAKKIFITDIQLPSVGAYQIKKSFSYSHTFSLTKRISLPPDKQALNCVWRI